MKKNVATPTTEINVSSKQARKSSSLTKNSRDTDLNATDVSKRIQRTHSGLVKNLLDWFELNSRPLPWRITYEPYSVWVSEIMLQQTQMERGVLYFQRWMKRFPTIESVANAPLDEILKLWEGLGYYSRARKLHETARLLVAEYNGIFPKDKEALKQLPGIGDYTAGAIAAIAFNLPVTAIDANVERVFSRLFDIAIPCKSPVAVGFISQMMEALMPWGKSREFIQGLMEFGALVCKKVPQCSCCPIQKHCEAYRLSITHERPIKGQKSQYTSLQVVTGVLAHNGRIFIQKRLNKGAWAGLWEFPGGRLEEGESPEAGVIREMLEETAFPSIAIENLGIIQHAYTKFKITLHCFFLRLTGDLAALKDFPVPVLEAATEYYWALPEELENYALPAGHRKLLDAKLDHIQSLIDS